MREEVRQRRDSGTFTGPAWLLEGILDETRDAERDLLPLPT